MSATIVRNKAAPSAEELNIIAQAKAINELKKAIIQKRSTDTVKTYEAALDTLKINGVAVRTRFEALIKDVDRFDEYGPAHPESKALKAAYETYKNLAEESKAIFNAAMDRTHDLAHIAQTTIRDPTKSLVEKQQGLRSTQGSINRDRRDLLNKKREFSDFHQNTLTTVFQNVETDGFPAQLRRIRDDIKREEAVIVETMKELRDVIIQSGNHAAKLQLQYVDDEAKDWPLMRNAAIELLDPTRVQVKQDLVALISSFLAKAESHWKTTWTIENDKLKKFTLQVTITGASTVSDPAFKTQKQIVKDIKDGDRHDANLEELQQQAKIGDGFKANRQSVMETVGKEISALRASIDLFDEDINRILGVFNVLTTIVDYITESIKPDPFIESLLDVSDSLIASLENKSHSTLTPIKA